MRFRHAFVPFCLLLMAGCGSSSPSAPSTPTPTLLEVRVGVAGGGSTTLDAGRTVQLYAQHVMSDGAVQDVTNAAFWQTSNPAIATVSAAGLVTTYQNGDVTISATTQKTGNLVLKVETLNCTYSLSPSSMSVDAFGLSSITVNVAASAAACKWTARSDVTWVRIASGANGTGNATFQYDVDPNSHVNDRAADVTVSGNNGTATHRVQQGHPSSCSYVVDPEEVTIALSGGFGTFRVNTTPEDCRWTAGTTDGGVQVTQNASGQGDRTVSWSAGPRGAAGDGRISVCGLSGQNPCGRFTIRWR
jgi:hypothetical protein